MRKAAGWILFAVSLLIAYQGYLNSQPEPLTEALARDVACNAKGSLCVAGSRPRQIRTDVIQRRYEWGPLQGEAVVVCRRDYVFFGAWHCTM